EIQVPAVLPVDRAVIIGTTIDADEVRAVAIKHRSGVGEHIATIASATCTMWVVVNADGAVRLHCPVKGVTKLTGNVRQRHGARTPSRVALAPLLAGTGVRFHGRAGGPSKDGGE